MVTHHLLDGLAVLPYLGEGPVLDVGAGAGLPGIPLAIMRPDQEFTLLDSNAKKTRFMRQAVIDLGLRNVNVVQQRVGALPTKKKYATVISRAFASLADMLTLAGHLCRPSGAILAMKGEYPTAELQALPAGFTLQAVIPLEIPGLEAQRHLVHIVPTKSPSGPVVGI